MTKPWISDRRQREAATYCATHATLAREIAADRAAAKPARSPRAPKRPADADQPDMFGAVTQPRGSRPEAIAVYEAVLALRRAGIGVFRAGRHTHAVGGRSLSDAQLAAVAARYRHPDGKNSTGAENG